MLSSVAMRVMTRAAAVTRPLTAAAAPRRWLSSRAAPRAVPAHVPAHPHGFAVATAPGALNLPPIRNEAMHSFAPGSAERAKLEAALARLRSAPPLRIPAVVGDKEIFLDGPALTVTAPSDHKHVLAEFRETDRSTAEQAITSCLSAKADWEALPFSAKAAIFLKAADLLSTKYRYDVLAAVMMGQGKNAWQAEIDGAAETIDFWRFNVQYAAQAYSTLQPSEHSATVWNRVEYRALEGFVLAVTPFNFAAIGANLASAPALMGNVVVWKPSNTALLSNYLLFKIMREAGLPPGVVNFLPGNGLPVSSAAFSHPDFAGLHFTGSTATFQSMWKTIGENITRFRSYPRIVGETGGKNFHFVHASACPEQVALQSVRSAFEYSGQKCSALSRLYVPSSLWPRVKELLVQHTRDIIATQMGPVEDLKNFVTGVIDERAFKRIAGVIDTLKADERAGKVSVIAGGGYDSSRGWMIEPTIAVAADPHYRTMREEIFGPVLTVFVYPDGEFERTLDLCDTTAPYALTGAVFAADRYALEYAAAKLRNSAGNFYINDKSTGAVVGQQPFGGGRGSGTNDKAGAMQNLLRWTSPRAIKESFVPITTYKYPHQG